MNFYDTNALLDGLYKRQKEKFLFSSITLQQIQEIKVSSKKDFQVKYKARQLIKWLDANQDKYQIITYLSEWNQDFYTYPALSMESLDDSRIIITALHSNADICFITHDLNCKHIASVCGLKTQYPKDLKDTYIGYKEIKCNTDEEYVKIYSTFSSAENLNNLLQNQYLLIKNSNDDIVSAHYYSNGHYLNINEIPFSSRMFGKTKAKDIYQQIAMDSLIRNKLTLLKGPAGSGKSYLSLTYLFDRLQKNKIDKIIIFCNTVATDGSAKLGFYPGTKDQKLLDSQIGNMLSSKIGDKIEIQRMIDQGTLLLLPMSDIRGYDTTDMRAGVYITQGQNFSISMLKLALQRAGQDSIFIVQGDPTTQLDLSIYGGSNNGMKRISEVFRGQDFYGQVTLKHIYRSRIAEIAQKM